MPQSLGPLPCRPFSPRDATGHALCVWMASSPVRPGCRHALAGTAFGLQILQPLLLWAPTRLAECEVQAQGRRVWPSGQHLSPKFPLTLGPAALTGAFTGGMRIPRGIDSLLLSLLDVVTQPARPCSPRRD